MKTEGTITALARTLKVLVRVALAAITVSFAGVAFAQASTTLTFEQLQAGWSNGYGGLQWSNFSLLDGVHYTNKPSGYRTGVVTPNQVVLNAYARPAELAKNDGPFNLLSGYLTGAWNDRLQVQVAGFYGNTLMYSNTYVVKATRPTLVHFDYLGVNRVVFSSTGGVHYAYFSGFGPHFVMDNLTISLPGENPAVIIQSPRENARLTNGVLTACGNAADNVQVAAVWLQLNHADWKLATGTIVWTAPDLTLIPGTNVMSAYAVDLDGNPSLTNTVQFVYVPSDLLRVQVVGPGTVGPDYGSQLLPIGRKILLTAKPARGAQFVGWTGSWTTKEASVGFIMASNLTVTATFVDVRRPVNVVTYPANKRYTNAVMQAVGKAADNVGVTMVWYQLNSNGWNQATTTNHWTNWTTKPLPLQLGTNLLQVMAEDAAHNLSLTSTVRFVKSATTLAQPGSRRWALYTAREILSSPTIGPDGVVYFGNNAKHLYALEGATGAKRWEIQLRGCVDSAPTLGPDGTLYVGTGGGWLYALEAATGREKWHAETGEWISSSPSVSSDGTVYCGCANNVLLALDAATGGQKWSFPAPYEVYSSPAIGGDGTVYFGAGTWVYALEGATGARRWEFPADSYVWASPALGCDGTVYISSAVGTFFALDGATGQVKWSFKTGVRIDSSAALGTDGTVYFGCNNGRLFALDGATGAKKWEFITQTQRPMISSPAIGADGVVYIGSWDGNLYAVDAATGRKRWRFFISGTIDGSPAVAPDGTVFIGSWNGWFCAINSDSPGLMESSWPKFKGGPLSVGQPGRCP